MPQQTEWTDMESPEMAKDGGNLGLFAAAWRRKWTVVCITTIALGLGYLYFLQAAPVYQSTAQLLLIKKEARLEAGGMDIDAQVGYQDTLSTHMLLVRSPSIVEGAVEVHDLGSLPSLRGSANPGATIVAGLKAAQGGGRDAPDPNIIDLAYKGPDPQDCATVLDAVIKSYQDFLDRTYRSFSDETVGLISQAKDELDRRLSEKEARYRQFRKESPLLWQGPQAANLHEARMAEIESSRAEVLVQNAQTKARIEAIETALEKGGSREALTLLIEHSDSSESRATSPSTTSSFEQMLFTALLEEQVLLEDYGPDHPKVKAIRKKLDLMREHLGSMAPPTDEEPVDFLAIYVDSLRQELKVGEQRLAELDTLFEKERMAAKSLADAQLEDQSLRNETARTQQMFDSVIKRLEEISMVKNYGGISTEVISRPRRGAQVEPQLALVMAVSGVLGLFAGLGLAYLAEAADKRFRSPDDIRRQLALPIVGHIPPISTGKEKRSRGDKKTATRSLSPLICTFHRPKGHAAEAYRAVRTSLYFNTSGDGLKVIQITSPNPGDGKTTLAANLAVSIASSGKRVLLMETDFRHPRVHDYFALENALGVSSVITSEAEISQCTQQTTVENLWAMTCGPRPQTPADLLTSPRFKELVDMVREEYDFVIVDSPPLLAVTDPCSVAPRVDAVLLVMRLSKSARDTAIQATEILNALGARVLGIVVNGVGGKRRDGYGSYRYGGYRRGGYQYGYGSTYGGKNGRGDRAYYSEEKSEEPTVDQSG